MAKKKKRVQRGPRPAKRRTQRKSTPARGPSAAELRESFPPSSAPDPAAFDDERLGNFSPEAIAAGFVELERCGLGTWAEGVFEITDEDALVERFQAKTLPPEAMLAAMGMLADGAFESEPPVLVRLADGRIVQPFHADPALEEALGFTADHMRQTRRELVEEGVFVLLHEAGEDELWGMLIEPEELSDWEIDPDEIPTQRPGESVRALLQRHGCRLQHAGNPG